MRDIREVHVAITTILFTDLVGSTALMQRAGDERARELVDAHRKALAEAVAASGGTELQWLGDGLMAAFASPADAVRGAIAMQQFPKSRGGAPELTLRIGLDVGELLEQERRGTGSGYFGTPVVIARRLCDLATGGQILCSSTVAGLLRGRAAFRFKELGAKTLKGMAEPELVFEIDFEQEAGPGPLPLPPLLASLERVALVGREQPLARLRAALDVTTGAGQRRASLIAGEPGIGKTRLAAELSFAAHAGAATVLFGRCDEDPLMPYQCFVEALRFAIASADPATLGRWVDRRGADLARLVPELAERLPVGEPVRGDPDNDRFRLFDAVIGFLENLSRERPLVLVLDDLHWADKPSLLLLMHLLRSSQPAPILVVGTYRETDLDRQHPLTEVLADLRRIEGYERVLLRGLDTAETEALMQSVAPHDPTAATRQFAQTIHQETEGNPFFLHEVIRHFKESGVIYEQEGRWTSGGRSDDELGSRLPEGVKEVVGRRLSRLSNGCQGALSRAAVQGRDFDLGVLERVTDLSGDQVLDAIDEAIAAGLVEPMPQPDRFRFSHALVRETLYGELTTSRRIRAHRQVGEALEAMGLGIRPERHGELALHFLEAAPGGDVAKAVEYGLSIARQAVDASAHEEAIAHCRRTLEVANADGAISPATRAELLTVLGESLITLGQPEEAQAVIEAVLALGDAVPPEIFARAVIVLRWARAPVYGVLDTRSTGLLARAIDRLDGAAPDLAIEVIDALARCLVSADVGLARSWHEKAEPLVAAATQPGTVIRHQLMAAGLRYAADEFIEALTLAEDALRRAEATGDQRIVGPCLGTLVAQLFATGDFDRVASTNERLAIVADATSSAFGRADVAQNRSALAWARGDMAGFAALCAVARRLAAPFPVFAQIAATQAVYAAVEQGRVAEMDDDIERFIAPSRDIPNFRSSWVLLELNRGHGNAVRDAYERMAANGFAEMNQDGTWLYSRCAAAACVIALGDRDRADQAYRMIRPLAHTNWASGAVLSWGSVSQLLGSLASLMERYDQAERHFEDALAMNTRMGHQPGLVKTRVEYAAMLMRRAVPGDRPRAAELGRTAQAHAESLGFRPWVERAAGIVAAATG